MGATIKDVARRARVSIASVSRALNGTGVVTDSIRERVTRAAKQLRYTPHGGARSLITRRTHSIGVLLPDMYGEYFSELIRGIDRAARARNLHLLVSSTHGDADEAAELLRSMSGRVDGLLLMSPHVTGKFLAEAIPGALPAVLISTPDELKQFTTLMIDNYGGARSVVTHLRNLGHRHIAHISGPANNFESGERLRGYRAALRGLAPPPGASSAETIVAGDFTEESGYLAGRFIAALPQRPDAIFAANDMMAIGCLYALTEAGLRVPQDVALAGFDDIPIARYMQPALTTVRIQIAELGMRALEALVQRIRSPKDAGGGKQTLKTELVVRASCGSTGQQNRAAGESSRR
ncbi:MAG: LacI family DNA-binding transcriptional regulator [Steroidobacteraceae bacterium]